MGEGRFTCLQQTITMARKCNFNYLAKA
jgi:hypothetical protein